MADDADKDELRRVQALRDAEIYAREGEDPDWSSEPESALVEALRQRDEARCWAWALEHREKPRALVEAGEPYWLTSPAPPWEIVYDALLADFTNGYGTVYRVSGLSVGDCVWLTDKSEPDPSDVDVVYAEVLEVGDGYVRVRILREATDVQTL